MRKLCGTSPSDGTHISQVEGDLQVVQERISKVGVHVENFQEVVPEDLMKITVGQSSDVGAGLSWSPVEADGLAEDVVLSCRNHSESRKFL